MRFQSIVGLAFIASVAALTGCGDDSSGSGGGDATTSSSSSGGQGGSGEGGGGGGGGGGDSATCTAAGEFCASFILPTGFAGMPTKLIVALYPSLPAAGAPVKVIKIEENPQIKAGEAYQVKAANITSMGTFTMLAVLYMPGGSGTIPTANVDYDAASDPLMLTGAATTVGPFEFALHTATDGHVGQ